jgi:hypothetical protein
MSSRIASAVLALIAAGSIALSLLVFAWWNGTPTIDGQKKDIKIVQVGLLTAEGCDNRGCQPVPLKSGFATTRYIELGTGGVLVASALILAILALAGSERRQVFSKIVISAAGASIIVALALLLMGPDFDTKQAISVPIDLRGMLTFWVGTGFAIIAGVLAMRPTPRVVLRPPRAAAIAASAPAPLPRSQPVDVLAFLDEPDPPPPPPPAMSPSGALPGPSGPLGTPFHSGPQLRPLYDAAPSQGGSGGFVPGMATPPPFNPRSATPLPIASAPPPPLPPPIRAKAPSIPPMTPPPRNSPNPSRPPALNRPQATFAAAVVPPPPPPLATPTPAPVVPPKQTMLPPMRAETDSDHLETVERQKHEAASLENTFDAAATAALPSDPSGTEQTEIGGSLSVGDSTNVSSISFETSGPTSESAGYDEQADDLLATTARDQISATDRDLPTVAEPASAAASIAAAVLAPSSSGNSSRIAISQPAPLSVKTPPAPAMPAITVPKILPVKTPPPRAPEAMPAKAVPMSTAPDSLPPPSEKQVKSSGPSPACPQCESPMAWVEAHLRFYCKSCRMYF